MDINELIESITSSLDELEGHTSSAENEANQACSYADEACSYASSAEEYARDAERAAEAAGMELSELRSLIDRLVEQVEALTSMEDVKENPAHSEFQRDMNKYKERVLSLRNGGANAAQIAEKLEIGEFLVSRILEEASASKAA